MRLKKFVDSSMWFQGPAQVDAYYAPNLNEMSQTYQLKLLQSMVT